MKILLTFISILLIFGFSTTAYGHGGFEKSSDNTTVFITQNPTSPLVREKVEFSFALKDLSIESTNVSDQNIINDPVKLKLTQTFLGDESKDKTILEKDFKTDENGNFSFEYVFDKEDYFDIELEYKDKSGKDHLIGFLVQPRNVPNAPKETKENNDLFLFSSLILGFAGGILIGKLRFGKPS